MCGLPFTCACSNKINKVKSMSSANKNVCHDTILCHDVTTLLLRVAFNTNIPYPRVLHHLISISETLARSIGR